MPPKKKPRLSSRAPSTLSVETPSEMVLVAPESGNAVAAKAGEVTPDDPMTDPWTDEQEISLFKGMIKWKPVGPFSLLQRVCANHNRETDPLEQACTNTFECFQSPSTSGIMATTRSRNLTLEYLEFGRSWLLSTT